jgi:membrane protein
MINYLYEETIGGDIMKNKDKIFGFLQKNYGWIVALLTGLTVTTSFVLRFIKYIYSNFYFDYYGISYELFNNNELGFLYNFGFSILILLCFGSLMYCYMQLFNKKEMNVKLKTIVFNILLIIVSNIIVVFSLNYKYSLCQLIFNFLALIAIEIVMSVIFFKIDKREKNKKYDLIDLSNTIKIVPFYIVLLLFSLILSYGSNIVMNKSYRIIGNDKVIVYTTNDYYLTLDCKIKNNELTIYKGKQSKINNEDVVSELINFDKVELK